VNPGLEQRLRGVGSAKPNAGASASVIDAVEAAANLVLPEEVRSFYLAFDGIVFEEGALEFLSLTKADALRRSMASMGFNRSWSYWPLTENNDSNPICVVCSGPMRGFVVQVFHDDKPKLKGRSFGAFLEATLDFISKDEWSLEFMPSEFDQAQRTAHDIETARALLGEASMKLEGDLERGQMECFAAWLFGEEQWAEVAKLLETGDEHVRRDVADRLSAMQHPRARRAVGDSKRDFRSFVVKCGDFLTRAGFRVDIDEHCQLQVLDGPIWLNMEMFFSERARQDLEQFLIERTTHLVKLKHQRSS
jgi:hypothetical protein